MALLHLHRDRPGRDGPVFGVLQQVLAVFDGQLVAFFIQLGQFRQKMLATTQANGAGKILLGMFDSLSANKRVGIINFDA
ncbi:MAG: hypothetical protein ABF318_19805, partial [Ketobacter sp.]